MQANLTEKTTTENTVTLRTPLRYLKGVGPEKSRILLKLGLYTAEDLLCFFPRRYEDRLPYKKISELSMINKECVRGTVLTRGLLRLKTGRSIFKVVISDGQQSLQALWFGQPYLQKVFEPNQKAVFYGKAEISGSHIQMIHPEYELFQETWPAQTVHTGRIVPLYALTEDLSQKALRQLAFRVIEDCSSLLKEWLDPRERERLALPERAWAFKEIHFPSQGENRQQAYRRLVYDEFLLMQIILEMKKAVLSKESHALKHENREEEVNRFIRTLDFELTSGQRNALREIVQDMGSGRVMNRLVQGDVGSGKTVVAAAGLVFTATNGFQGVLMAPTEVLAQQHFIKISQLLEPMGICCGYLAQGLSQEEKRRTLAGIASGSIQVVVGTHALIQKGVNFKKLGLVVIDEQHKFGVFQRAALKNKNTDGPHFLLMTATPIPRTLTLTLYGDLDISTMVELPKGRQPIHTYWVGTNKRVEVYDLLEKELQAGRQAYVICPLIEEKAMTDLRTVMSAHAEFSKTLSHRRLGVLHGKMKSPEKNKIMHEFKEKRIDILISTVVIEVGVDVPNASVMIIENADRFGLAQLHQLRGRVGRGLAESYCVLFSDATGLESVERLQAFQATSSGFDIAQMDLKIRGGGDVIGQKQHGLPELRIGDLAKDMSIMELAKSQARALIANDPKLEAAKNRLIRHAIGERFGLKIATKMTTG